MPLPFWSFPLLLAGCSESDLAGTETAEDRGPVGLSGHGSIEVIVVEPSEVLLPTTRDSGTLVATAAWTDGFSSDVTELCAWTHSDYGVAVISGAGEVHGLGVGTTTATCEAEGLRAEAEITVEAVAALEPGDLVLNELLVAVPEGADVNGDGESVRLDEQFVELVNASAYAIDLYGTELWVGDVSSARHRFGAGSLLPGDATVLFGGGTPWLSVQRCVVLAVYNDDGAEPKGLALNSGGDTVRLVDADGAALLDVSYGASSAAASLVLDPELSGTSYADHRTLDRSVGEYSPCTLATGAAFPTAEENVGE